MKLQFLLCVAAAVLVAVCGEEEETEGARLLVAKHVHNKYLVENMDVIVKVNILMSFIHNLFVIYCSKTEIFFYESISKSQLETFLL